MLNPYRAYLTGSYNASFVKTYNFAKGAATIDRKLVEPLFPMTYSFHEQVYDLFMPKYADDPGDPHVHFASSNQLFLVLFGLVDISLLSRDPDHLNTTIIEGICATYEDALSRVWTIARFYLFCIPSTSTAPEPALSPDLSLMQNHHPHSSTPQTHATSSSSPSRPSILPPHPKIAPSFYA